MATTNVTFPGLASILRGEIIITRGITPSAAVLLCVPEDGVTLSPGALTFNCNGSVEFPDCLPLTNTLRKIKLGGGWAWALVILDHRWRWASGSISGEYNRRLPNGAVDPDTQMTPSELADLCLEEMGEAGYDTSEMPSNVYPYVLWDNLNPGLALKQVCEAVACEVCGGEIASVFVQPLGTGQDLPSGGNPLHPPATMTRPNQPTRLVLYGGNNVYCHKLKASAVGLESDGTTKLINNLSYKPSGGWPAELPGVFGNLSTTNQALAQGRVWQWYDVVGQSDGSLAVPGSNTAVSSIDQYAFLDTRLDQDTDLSGVKRPRAPQVTGTFWDYTDEAVNTSADTLYQGDFTWDAARGRVCFPVPIFSLTSSQTVQEPTINVLVSYHVKDFDGNPERLVRVRQIGGQGGDFIISRPELFDTVNQTIAAGVGSAEAEKTLDLWEQAFDQDVLADVSYAGLMDVLPSGIIAQVTITGSSIGDEGWTTRVCRLEEMNPEAPSEKERKRRELLQLLDEERL